MVANQSKPNDQGKCNWICTNWMSLPRCCKLCFDWARRSSKGQAAENPSARTGEASASKHKLVEYPDSKGGPATVTTRRKTVYETSPTANPGLAWARCLCENLIGDLLDGRLWCCGSKWSNHNIYAYIYIYIYT
jgi:hypothetical protein